MQSLRVKLMIFWAVFAALLVTVTNSIAFQTGFDAQFQQLRQTLMAIATTGALNIDGDLHDRIPREASSVNLPAYRELVQQLRAIRNAHPTIRYVYTLAPSKDSTRWHYLGDAEERKASLPGELYNASRYPSMLAGLDGPSADPSLTYDEWGATLSGYAPIRAHDGRVVGILGIDMSGQEVARTQQALRRWRLMVLALGLAVAVLLSYRIASWITRPLRALVQATQHIGEGDLGYRVPLHADDEVGTLGRSFNRMAELLAASMQKLQEHILATLQSLAAALEAKDVYTRGHSERVHYYAVKIAEHLGLPKDELELISRFSRLHDIGKIGITENILNKPSSLTPEEFDMIKRHPDFGYKILAPLRLPKIALDIVRHHHERQDGRGYPAGLKGEEIPLMVAIVSTADAFDGMTGYRPYRPKPMSFSEAVEELRRCTGTQFHLTAVDALIAVLREEGKLA